MLKTRKKKVQNFKYFIQKFNENIFNSLTQYLKTWTDGQTDRSRFLHMTDLIG